MNLIVMAMQVQNIVEVILLMVIYQITQLAKAQIGIMEEIMKKMEHMNIKII